MCYGVHMFMTKTEALNNLATAQADYDAVKDRDPKNWKRHKAATNLRDAKVLAKAYAK